MLYEHDRDRYSRYFTDTLPIFEPTRHKATGTTEALVGDIERMLGAAGPSLLPDVAKPGIERALRERDGRAVTSALFSPYLDAQPPVISGEVRRVISSCYTTQYQQVEGADIATGLSGFSYFDAAFPRGFPNFDLGVLSKTLRQLGLGKYLDRRAADEMAFWESVLGSSRAEGLALAGAVQQLINFARQAEFAAGPSRGAARTLADRIGGWVESARENEPQSGRDLVNAVLLAAAAIAQATEELGALEFHEGIDVLVVVATDIEEEALRAAITARSRPASVEIRPRAVVRHMGRYRRGTAAFVRCRIGGHSLGGALDVTRDAIDELSPTSVVMVGIAFGVDEQTQPIGSVLISEAVIDYESKKVKRGRWDKHIVEQRSEPGPADPHLVDAFRALGAGRSSRTQVGPLLSDHTLVDDLAFRNALVDRFPAAIGGEMEGYGIYVAAAGRNTPWVLVKAVCDWGDGKKSFEKDARQRLAAREAVERLFEYLDAP
ncbi:MAG: hypothetical protein QOK28_1329 [Actinomycetota bacterium]